MSIEFNFDVENRKLLAHLEEVKEKVERMAEVKALNSTAGKIKREAAKLAKTTTGIAQKKIAKRIVTPKNKRATKSRPWAYVVGKVWNIHVDDLTPAPRELKSGRVKYKVIPGETVENAFFATMPGRSKRTTMARKGRPRLPIKYVSANVRPHIVRALETVLHGGQAKAWFEEYFFKQMDRDIRSALRRRGLDVK